ncbi:MAG TPA: hypothetical protein VML35_06390 [Gaiellaceae bacterium]|nr:hypothetical protein [Gaiellaceae bacterium]
MTIEILVPEGPHGVQALLSTLAPRAAMTDFIIQPNEQFVHVLEGHVRGRADADRDPPAPAAVISVACVDP